MREAYKTTLLLYFAVPPLYQPLAYPLLSRLRPVRAL